MPLRLLPDIVYPITQNQVDPLMDNVAQLNTLDAGVTINQQKALTLYFHIFDLYVKSHGRIDYRGKDGQARLMQDAMTFVGTGNPVATRHGDLPAAHLSIDYHDTQTRLAQAGLPILSAVVNDLIAQCADLAAFPPQIENRVGLLMDYLGKRKLNL